MKVYAFDVDETLDYEHGYPHSGPISLGELRKLHDDGHVVGLCGNWAAITMNHDFGWARWCSFLGPLAQTKDQFLETIRRYIPASEYVMVGNDPTVKGSSNDAEAARLAGWRFIREDTFASGQR